MIYRLMNNYDGILRTDENEVISTIPADPANTDWQEYQAWLAADPENNIPESAD